MEVDVFYCRSCNRRQRNVLLLDSRTVDVVARQMFCAGFGVNVSRITFLQNRFSMSVVASSEHADEHTRGHAYFVRAT
jgi:hypothetical protein